MSAPAPPPDRARWARVTDLFDRAVDLPRADREAWLAAACGSDDELRRDVASLLDAHDRGASFIETPAVVAAAADAGTDALLEPGRTVGPYRVKGLLGEGGMGVVYLAEDIRLGRDVALKAVSPAFAADTLRTERLRREARAAAALSHPAIATVYALEEIASRWYIASEHVPGDTMRDELARGPMPAAVAIETTLALARALAAAHARGIVHRDLKPENVVRSPDAGVKILDFGLASFGDGPLAGANLTADGTMLGTPGYMSPEQIRSARVDGRSDLFALGVILYEAVTGVHPFAGPSTAATLARILEDEPVPMTSVAPASANRALVERLWPVVSRALAKSPEARFQSAGEMAAAIEAAAHDRVPPPRVDAAWSGTASPHAVWWWQFHQLAAAVSYALLLIPLWRVRDMSPSGLGVGLFLAGLVAAVVAGTLRLHLWFTLRTYPGLWAAQQEHSRRWLMGADTLFTLVLLAEGLTAIRVDDPAAAFLVAAAAATAVSFIVIEPATTRAARGDRRG